MLYRGKAKLATKGCTRESRKRLRVKERLAQSIPGTHSLVQSKEGPEEALGGLHKDTPKQCAKCKKTSLAGKKTDGFSGRN